MSAAFKDIGLVCWACGGICDGSDHAGSEQRAELSERENTALRTRAESAEIAFIKILENEVKMADAILSAKRFAKAWKSLARGERTMRMLYEEVGAGQRRVDEERAHVVAWLRQAPQGETPTTCAERIERGDHLKKGG
jgi:hypothetical protein